VTLEEVSPGYGGIPVRSSIRTHPKLQISDLNEYTPLVITSGAFQLSKSPGF